MTGLDKIIEHIRQDAAKEAAAVLDDAKRQVEALQKASADECRELELQLAQKSDEEVKLAINRGDSAAALAKRKLLLNAKQQLIGDVLDRARHSLLNLPDSEYFDTMKKMVKKYELNQPGSIVFSKRDRDRLPANFAAGLENSKLSVSDKTAAIDGGFILEYGDISENCSFEALFSAQKEVLQDKIRDLLFE